MLRRLAVSQIPLFVDEQQGNLGLKKLLHDCLAAGNAQAQLRFGVLNSFTKDGNVAYGY